MYHPRGGPYSGILATALVVFTVPPPRHTSDFSGHVCADCGKKCNSAAQLSNHKRNHNKVRCPAPWCDYVGKRWDQVKTHMRNRHHLLHETEAGSPSGRSATKRRSASSGDKEAGSSSGRSATKRRSASSDVDDGPKETKRVRLGSDGVQQSNVVDSVVSCSKFN